MIALRFQLTSPFSGDLGFSGVPLRAAFLNLLRESDEQLSNEIHDSDDVRTYALDPFPLDSRLQTLLREGERCEFGVNLFKAEQVERALRGIALKPHRDLRIHQYAFPLNRIDFSRSDPEKLMSSWSQLVPANVSSPVIVRMRFTTPTQLSHYGTGRAYLVPTPDKVFSGLLRVWNTVEKATKLAEVSDYRDWVDSNVYISAHRLRTVRVSLGRSRSFVGFVGNVTYQIDDSRDPLSRFTVGLARFGEMCNVGKNRTAGMGRIVVSIGGQDTREEGASASEGVRFQRVSSSG